MSIYHAAHIRMKRLLKTHLVKSRNQPRKVPLSSSRGHRSEGEGEGERRSPFPSTAAYCHFKQMEIPVDVIRDGDRIVELSEWQHSPDRFASVTVGSARVCDEVIISNRATTDSLSLDDATELQVLKESPRPPGMTAIKQAPLAMISFAPDQTVINEKMRELAQTSSWVPGVAPLSERMFLKVRRLMGLYWMMIMMMRAVSQGATHPFHGTTSTYTSGLSSDSALKRRVKRRLQRKNHAHRDY